MMETLHANGRTLAYVNLPSSGDDNRPSLIFLCGFHSSMEGIKALAFEDYCRSRGLSFTRFDYSGHGSSSGDFEAGCIGDWLVDTLAIFDHLMSPPCIVLGSSMGAWIGLLLARLRKPMISGFVGISSAPDFTERQIRMALSSRQQEELQRFGRTSFPSCYEDGLPYPITSRLIDDGVRHRVMGNTIPLDCPVRLVHGTADQEIPWQTAVELARYIASDDLTITLIKDGDHRLSTRPHLNRIFSIVDGLVANG